MKFTISSSALLKHLSYVSGVISTNPTIPILENFLFVLQNNQLSITGSDVETMISTNVEVSNSKEDGKICIPSKLILDYLKNIAEQSITFVYDAKNSNIKVTTTSGSYKFKGEDAQHYPKKNTPSNETSIKIKNHTILDAINNTLYAISSDESRPSMNGLFFEMKPDKNHINFVSTDGHRLAVHTSKEISGLKQDSFIIPKKPLSIMKNIIQDNGDVLDLNYDKTMLFISTTNIQMSCRLLEGNFPDYNSVLPTNNPYNLTVAKDDLQKALKRVSIFSSKYNNLVRFSIKGGELKLSAKDDDFDIDAEEKLECHYSGEDIVIGFNSKSLIEILNPINTKEVVLNISMPNKPVLIKPAEGNEHFDLVMLQIPLVSLEETN